MVFIKLVMTENKFTRGNYLLNVSFFSQYGFMNSININIIIFRIREKRTNNFLILSEQS